MSRAVDRLLAAYLTVSGVALLFPHRPAGWPLLAALHALAALALLRPQLLRGVTAPAGRRWPRTSRALADWYPLLLIPLLYTELAVLNQAIFGDANFDPIVQRWEEAIFGRQPSYTFARALPSLLVSELLHGAYLSYYPIIFAPPLALYLRGRHADFAHVLFTIMLVFFGHYLFFIYFPVQGPRYLFPAPDGGLVAGPAYQLAHFVLERGSSRGAAFPSSHVAIVAAQAALAARLLPRWFPVLALAAAGVALGAVYGGFHYATDVVGGIVLGLTLVALAPRMRALLT